MHRIRLVTATVFIAALLIIVVPGVASAAPAGWWTGRVMVGDDYVRFQNPPCVTDKLVAAVAFTGYGGDLWVWRTGAAAPSRLTTAFGIDGTKVAASGGRVVWQETDAGFVQHLKTWAIGDASPTEISAGHAYSQISLSGDRAAWADSSIGRVCTWKKGVSGVTTLPGDPFGNDQYNPSVSGDRIVYEQSDGNTTRSCCGRRGPGRRRRSPRTRSRTWIPPSTARGSSGPTTTVALMRRCGR